MPAPTPIYTAENCTAAYQLNWAVSLFGNQPLPDLRPALEAIRPSLEADGVRVLEFRASAPNVCLCLVSTKPAVSPSRLLQVLKGRLQHAIREETPKAFRRNYRIESVGSAKHRTIERYVARQPERHPMADLRASNRLTEFQISSSDANLSELRYSTHGQFLFNLHLVLEHEDGWCMTSKEFVRRTHNTILGACQKHGFLLSRGGIAANHLHLAMGCGIDDSPMDVALCFLNNLAYAHGQRPLYRFSFYVGTFGAFDLGALRNARESHHSLQAASHRGKPDGD